MSESKFLFDEDEEAFRASVRKFAQVELAEGYLERARSEKFPWDAYRALGSHGLLGLGISEEGGGQAADLISVGIACEEVARADFNMAFCVFNASVAGSLLERHLSPELREEWIPQIASGERLTGLGLTEPGSGSDSAAMTTRAEKVDGGWRLYGEKTSVSLAPHAHALTIFAKTDPERGARGVSAFFVPMDDPSISTQRFEDSGFRPMGRGAAAFNGTFVPESHLLGEVNRGFHLVMGEFDYTRSLLGLCAIGAAQLALDMTIAYAKDREAFGRPIATFQGVSFPIAEYATYLEGIKWLCYRALALRQAGLPHTKEAAMIKWWAPQVAVRAIHDCIILHGHVAYSEELPLQQLLRDAAALEIGDGTPQIQKLIVARDLFGRDLLPY